MQRSVVGSAGILAALTLIVSDVTAAPAELVAADGPIPSVTAAQRDPSLVRPGPRFNIANGNTGQRAYLDWYVKRMIDGTPRGALIEIAMYRFTDWPMARAVVRAKRRGVRVRIVLDSNSREQGGADVHRFFVSNLGTDRRRASWIVVCPTGQGCVGRGPRPRLAKNHNKFYLFSQAHGARNLVVQTSRNATKVRYSQWNDLYTMTDPRMYRVFRRYFDDLAKRRANPNYWRGADFGPRGVRFLPRRAGDPILDVLNTVSCAGGTRLWVTSGIFTRSLIARKLWRLDDAGCAVQVVSSSYGRGVVAELTRAGGRHGGPEARFFEHGGGSFGHSKYLLIDGWVQGGRRRLVVTGSHSYTVPALRFNDEVLLSLRERGTFAPYARNFAKVFADAAGRLRTGSAGSASGGGPVPIVPDDADETDETED